MLVQYKADIIIISSNVACSRHDIAEHFSLGVQQQSLIQSLNNTHTKTGVNEKGENSKKVPYCRNTSKL